MSCVVCEAFARWRQRFSPYTYIHIIPGIYIERELLTRTKHAEGFAFFFGPNLSGGLHCVRLVCCSAHGRNPLPPPPPRSSCEQTSSVPSRTYLSRLPELLFFLLLGSRSIHFLACDIYACVGVFCGSPSPWRFQDCHRRDAPPGGDCGKRLPRSGGPICGLFEGSSVCGGASRPHRGEFFYFVSLATKPERSLRCVPVGVWLIYMRGIIKYPVSFFVFCPVFFSLYSR